MLIAGTKPGDRWYRERLLLTIDALDIQSWEVTSLPEGAEKTGSANVSYSGTDATITTYDDPSVVTVTAMGQDITLAVPDSAQSYLPFLSYLG